MKVRENQPKPFKKKKNNFSNNKQAHRNQANIRERQRTKIMNLAFDSLKEKIPFMPEDKLSKIKTLVIAKEYIQFLKFLLSKEPMDKYEKSGELKKAFSIWKVDNKSEDTSSSDYSNESLEDNFETVVQQFNNNLHFFGR